MAALDPLFVPGGLSPRDARIALGGLLASQGAGLDIRTGVLSGYTVTGTSATGPMRVSVAPGHHVAMRSTSDGPEVGANDGATTVDIPAAPASNARIDLVWVRATDTERDGATAAEIGVTATGAVSATPTGPYGDVPSGALVLAEVRVAAGAVRTTDPQVTITMVAKRTAARGGILPVATQAERDALTAYDGLVVARLDTGVIERRHNGAWGPSSDMPRTGRVALSGAKATTGTDITAAFAVTHPVAFDVVLTVLGAAGFSSVVAGVGVHLVKVSGGGGAMVQSDVPTVYAPAGEYVTVARSGRIENIPGGTSVTVKAQATASTGDPGGSYFRGDLQWQAVPRP